jgi:hypothetical protein
MQLQPIFVSFGTTININVSVVLALSAHTPSLAPNLPPMVSPGTSSLTYPLTAILGQRVCRLRSQAEPRTKSAILLLFDTSIRSPADKRAPHRTWLPAMRQCMFGELYADRANISLPALYDKSIYEIVHSRVWERSLPLTGNRHIEHEGDSCAFPHCSHLAVCLSTLPSSQKEHC